MNSKMSYSILMFLVLGTALAGLSGCSTTIDPTELSASIPKERFAPDQMHEDLDAANTVQVDFMLRGYCKAGSSKKDTRALGGFWKSDNMPQPISREAAKSSGACYLLAQPNVPTRFGHIDGMRLVLVNGTRDHIAFTASDSRLSIIQEAQDVLGNWKPIEFLPASFCGNSFHRVFLPAGTYWAFPTPRYKGPFKTKLRFCLRDHQGQLLLVSNEFSGSIHPGQFSKVQAYDPDTLVASPVQPALKKEMVQKTD